MIDRYSRSEMKKVWSEKRKYVQWLRVELAASEEFYRKKVIPNKDWRELKKQLTELIEKESLNPDRVTAHEAVLKHDVIAFTTAVAEKIGPVSRYVHFGLTSSDVVDTALSLQIQEGGEILDKGLSQIRKTLLGISKKYKKLPTIGRSHGIFAEPTSFGLKFLGFYCEFSRRHEDFKQALETLRVGKVSGAVGVNAHLSPEDETRILKRLNLKREAVSTQVIPRDRHAALLFAIAHIGSALERLAIELRHLQRSEVGEVLEGFSSGQKGSSAMPHKRNPISSENITGLSRLLRSYLLAGLENVALWHERDISHSSVERVTFPDAFLLVDYALDRMNRVLSNLEVREDQILKNLNAAGDIAYSGHLLLELVKKGCLREDAYRWVQSCAILSMDQKKQFQQLLLEHKELQKHLSPKEIKTFLSSRHQLRHVDAIFEDALKVCPLTSE